jgi:polypeptide N-acetylgalactosaminyltransferase
VAAEKNAESHSSRSSSSSPSRNNLKGGQEQGGVLAAPHNPEGPGEMGRPVVVDSPDPDTKRKIDEGWQNNAFNQYVSDMISVHRTLPDFRRVSLLFKHNYIICT